MTSALSSLALVVVIVVALASAAYGQPAPAAPAQTPPAQTPPAQGPAQPAKPAPKVAQKPRAAGPLTLNLEVTDRTGNALGDVAVELTGPVERSGTTSAEGTIAFRSLRPGTYRLRFEGREFTILEREVVLRAGQPAGVSVALTPAPEAPSPAPSPDPAPEPAEKPERPVRDVDPRSLSIPDFLDKNLIGGEPHRMTLLGCAEGGTARLLQIRDPLNDQQHAEVDEILYIVAGAGVMRIRNQDTKVGPGFVALVPRGVAHSIRREGRNPLIALSVLAGEPCTDGTVPIR